MFAFSVSFNLTGSAGREQQEAIFTLAHVQDPVVQYASARGLSLMRPLWKSWFRGDGEMLDYHYADFRKAWKLAQAYSDQLAKDAYKSGSESYVDIVALSARQVIGATTFSGTSEAPLLFLKEISSNGNCQTVDVIFPAFPFFLYTNSLWLAYLLEPLLEHQRSGQYPNHYSMHDLGSHFPNMTGHPDGRDEYMPLEECGDMLIMTLALVNSIWYGSGHEPSYQWSLADLQSHPVDDDGGRGVFPVRATEAVDGLDRLDDGWKGDAEGLKQAQAWLRRSYPLLKQWTRYLVEFALEPHNQRKQLPPLSRTFCSTLNTDMRYSIY